jgi:hypothetical protein
MHIMLAQMMKNFRIEYLDDKPLEYKSDFFYGPASRMDLALVDLQ